MDYSRSMIYLKEQWNLLISKNNENKAQIRENCIFWILWMIIICDISNMEAPLKKG